MSLYKDIKQSSYKNAINKLAKKTEDIVEVLESDNILDALGLEIARENGYNMLQIGGDIVYMDMYNNAKFTNLPVYILGDNDIFAFIEKHSQIKNDSEIDIISRYVGSMCYSNYINNNSGVFTFANENPEGNHTLNALYYVGDEPEKLADVNDIEYSVIILRKKGE